MSQQEAVTWNTDVQLRYYIAVNGSHAWITGSLSQISGESCQVEDQHVRRIRRSWPDQETLDDLVWQCLPFQAAQPGRLTFDRMDRAVHDAIDTHLRISMEQQGFPIKQFRLSNLLSAQKTSERQISVWDPREPDGMPVLRRTGWLQLAESEIHYAFYLHPTSPETAPELHLSGMISHQQGTWRGSEAAIRRGLNEVRVKESMEEVVRENHNSLSMKRTNTLDTYVEYVKAADSMFKKLINGRRKVFLPRCTVQQLASFAEL